MKYGLRADNNKFVCAELGGGIDSRVAGHPVAVRANRSGRGPWESFEEVKNSNGSVSLKTQTGYFVTAENGGGGSLSTNRREIGGWEQFWKAVNPNGGWRYLTSNGQHYLCAEVGSPDPVVNATRTSVGGWETFWPDIYESDRVFPPEAGDIHVNGQYFQNNGATWTYRGVSLFLLHARYLRGESIQPQIQWMQSIGANVARIFCAGIPWGGEWEFYRFPWQRADYEDSLAAVVSQLTTAGLRAELVPITYEMPVSQWRGIVQRVYNVSSHFWNTFVEVMNEPGAYSSLSPREVMQGVNTFGIPTSYGHSGADLWPANRALVYPLNGYITWHSERDRRRFPRNSKDGLELRQMYFCPIINDEPFGIAEYNKDGSGARTTDLDGWRTHHAISNLYNAGTTLHTQAGLEGRNPGNNEPITLQAGLISRDMWKFIPPHVQTGLYTRQGFSDFPIVYNTGDSTADDKAYGSFSGDAWAVVPKPRSGFGLVGRNGWQVRSSVLNEVAYLKR